MGSRGTVSRQVGPVRRAARPRLVLTVLAIVLATGCTTRTTGMQAPLGHDYDGMRWYALEEPVSQRIIVAPGYTALVENDPGTDHTDLVQRIEQLPEDVRSSEIEEVRLAVRPTADRAFVPALAVEVAVDEGSDRIVAGYDDLRFDGDWVVITDLPADVVSGQTLVVTIEAAPGWEYGRTPDRIPYGGSVASAGPVGGDQQALRGSLGFQTIFAQQTDLGEIASLGVETALPAVLTDPVLLAIYAMILVGGVVVLVVRRRRVGMV